MKKSAVQRHLMPLVQDHLSTILMARNIGLGSPNMNIQSLTFPQKIDFVIRYFETRLIFHHDAEEKILFPIIRQFTAIADDVVPQLVEEHRRIRFIVESFDNSMSKRQLLSDLGHLLENHVVREEKYIYTQLKQILPEEILQSTEEEILKYYRSKLQNVI